MAVFFKKECRFNGCGSIFSDFSSLIEHIENTHIDFDTKVTAELERQQPSAIPLSYILKYSENEETEIETNVNIHIRLLPSNGTILDKYNTPYRMESSMDVKVASESESSNDSWMSSKSLPAKITGNHHVIYNNKPYACSMPGCKKRYKNINGIRYHFKNGHKIFEKTKKSSKHSLNKRNRREILKNLARKCSAAVIMPSQITGNYTSMKLPSSDDVNISIKWNDLKRENNITSVNNSHFTATNNFFPCLNHYNSATGNGNLTPIIKPYI